MSFGRSGSDPCEILLCVGGESVGSSSSPRGTAGRTVRVLLEFGVEEEDLFVTACGHSGRDAGPATAHR